LLLELKKPHIAAQIDFLYIVWLPNQNKGLIQTELIM
jgi:hypothetical protein